MELSTARFKLKELSLNDLQQIHNLHSLPESDQFNTLGIPESIFETKLLLTEWELSKYETPRKRYVFYVESKENEFIGLIGITLGKINYKNAEIWYKLHPIHWNKGLATELVNHILNFCFTDLKLHRIEAGSAINNIASIKVLEKCGFIKEGKKRKTLPIRGEWVDNYWFSILEEEFNLKLPKLIQSLQ